MGTLTELINATCDDLNRSDMTANCSDAVVMAIRHYDSKRWWFAEGSATFTTTASTTAYVLATDFREMDYMEAQYTSGSWTEVVQRDFQQIKRQLQGGTSTGYPSEFAIYDQQIYLANTPNGAYSVRYYYQKALTDLTAAASNAWTTDCKDLIRASAARTVATRTLHDPELAQLHAAIEQMEYQRLVSENERRTTTGKSAPQY